MSESNFIIATETTSSAVPLDFSFKTAIEISKIIYLEPRAGRRTPIPEEDVEESKDGAQQALL
jgi:hypothetical protein